MARALNTAFVSHPCSKKHAVLQLCDLILPYSVVKSAELSLVKAYLDKANGSYYSATGEDLTALIKLRELKRVA